MLRIVVIIYAGVIVLMAGLQRHFIYYPGRAPEAGLLDMARHAGLEPWRGAEGEVIGWRSSSIQGAVADHAIVIFHGNAGFALDRTYYVEGFAQAFANDAWQTHLFEYPGYGARSGRPSERSIKQAAAEAVGQLVKSGRRILLVGESLGGGVASHLAAMYPEEIVGLLLITPFTSLVDVARHHYPFLPVGLLLRERYDNVEALKEYRGPIVFLLAGQDEVVPVRFGRRLHDQYAGPKMLIVQRDQSHNTLMVKPHEDWWRDATGFLMRTGHRPQW